MNFDLSHLTLNASRRHRMPPTSMLRRSERLATIAIGVDLLAYGWKRRSSLGLGAQAVGVPLIVAGIAGARPWPGVFDDDTRDALSGPKGIHVKESVRIARPVSEVYEAWRDLERLPTIVDGLERVTVKGDGRSHWVAHGPGNLPVEWDAQVINDEANKVIGWRTLPGSDVQCAGAVRFEEAPGQRGTQVTVHLQYAPPAGRVGATIARLAGRDPGQEVREGLRRFRQVLEAGELPTNRAFAGERS